MTKTAILRTIMIGGFGISMLLATASAQSLREARAQRAEERRLEQEVAFTESVCGTQITASIDWATAASWPDGHSLAQSCDGALGAVEAICRAPGGKAKVSTIKSFVCAADGGGASLNGGTLRYGASPGENAFANTKQLLDRKL